MLMLIVTERHNVWTRVTISDTQQVPGQHKWNLVFWQRDLAEHRVAHMGRTASREVHDWIYIYIYIYRNIYIYI